MKSKQQVELSFKEKVIEALNNHWKLMVAIVVAGVLVLAGILIADYVNRGRMADSAMLSEDIQEAYTEWMADSPENRDDTALVKLIDEALSDYPKQFAGLRATYTKGLMALENEDWTLAADLFEEAAEKWPESYLAPVSLHNAGAAREELGEIDNAVELWQKIVDDYSLVSADAPEALFNIGRVQESQGDTAAALETYKSIGADFPESRWTDISKSRILVIESR